MLEDEPVKIGNPQRTVRPGLECSGAEPGVPRGEEFLRVRSLGATAFEAESVRRKHLAADDVVGGGTDEK